MATKINTRSPFYVKVSNASLASATLELYIYTGVLTTNKPASAQYTITKNEISGNNYVVFEISELVRDYIEIEFNGEYDSQTVWVEADIVTTISGTATGTDSDKLIDSTASFTSTVSVGDIAVDSQGNIGNVVSVDSDTQLTLDNTIFTTGEAYEINQELNTDYIAFDGYGYFEEGINPELSRTYLQSNYKISRPSDTNLRVPVFTEDTDSVSFLYKGEVKRVQTVSSSTNTNAQIEYITVSGSDNTDTYKERVLADGGTFEDNSLLDAFLDAVDIGLVDELYINSNSGTEVIKISQEPCTKYEPYKVTFVNKFGALQDMWFSLKSTESLNTTGETYKANVVDFSTLTYATYKPQVAQYNKLGKESITLNTNYISEDYNEVIKQLMMSEQVWITKITDTEEVLAVIPKTQNVTYKTSLNDRLVQYTVDFEYAFDKINTVR